MRVETEMVVQNRWEISLTGNCKEMKYIVTCTNAWKQTTFKNRDSGSKRMLMGDKRLQFCSHSSCWQNIPQLPKNGLKQDGDN